MLWEPQEGPQLDAILSASIPEMLYGGARGGGKSDFLLGDWCAGATQGEVWRGVVFRKTYPELEELMARSQSVIPACWPGAVWWKSEKTWRLPNRAELRMRNLETPEDAARYQGHSYAWIGWDELTQWSTDAPYRALMACLRSAQRVRNKRVRATANPGGGGHGWVKARFIDPAPAGYEVLTDPESGMERIFIPAHVADNRILLANDPGYVDRLRMVGSEELVRAWMEGDWTVVVGAYFPEFGPQHIVRPFRIPRGWLRFRAFDWGSARPSCCLWFAVSDGTVPGFPAGCLLVYRELYLASAPNVGLRLTVEQTAARIKEVELGDEPAAYSVADPAIFAADGGPSFAERFAQSPQRILFRPADNRRVRETGAMGGWDMVRHRLVGDDGLPMLYLFSTCSNLIRTLPLMQHDKDHMEDVDTDSEDHACFVAGTIVNGAPIEQIGVLTRCDTQTTLLRFDDGTSVECTPDHLFLTESGAWVRANHLATIRVLSALPVRSSWESVITSAGATFSARAVDCIARCGSIITGLSRRAFTFTTSTMTAPTTASATSTCCPAALTSRITGGKIRALLPPRRPTPPQRSGTAATKAGNGTDRTGATPLPSWQPAWLNWFARCAGSLSRRRLTWLVARSSATSTARCVRCVAVEPQSERKDVYCLATDAGWVRLANGVIASNCDTLRYGCMSRPWVRAVEHKPQHLTIEHLWKMRERERSRY